MKLLSFEYRQDGWTLGPVTFGQFDLLVGISGAGKSRIVRAIEGVCAVALGGTERDGREGLIEDTRGASFSIEFEHEGVGYAWQADLERGSSVMAGPEGPRSDTALITRERLWQGKQELVRRDAEQFLFKGQPLPRLDRAKGAISILKEDPLIAPLYTAFERCIFRALEWMPSNGITSEEELERLRSRGTSLEELGADIHLPLHHRAHYLGELFPGSFQRIEASFRDAFPSVRRLSVLRYAQQNIGEKTFYKIVLAAEEVGVDRSISFDRMSSGMQRYLSFLVHLSFAPKGTVVLIDELEASFGVNCLPAATDFLLSRAPDIQFIVTSHHPYIIDRIPSRYWKIVTRRGSHVRVLDATTIPALTQGKSHLDNFSRLINLPEYEHGIQGEPS